MLQLGKQIQGRSIGKNLVQNGCIEGGASEGLFCPAAVSCQLHFESFRIQVISDSEAYSIFIIDYQDSVAHRLALLFRGRPKLWASGLYNCSAFRPIVSTNFSPMLFLGS